MLHFENVGDGGFVLIRGGKIVYKSPVQEHKFNCPYQLGNTADNLSLAQVCNAEVYFVNLNIRSYNKEAIALVLNYQ